MPKRNILLVIADQLSATALPAWGNTFAQTPAIDAITNNGVRFQNAYTNCPLCQPSRASFWTGQYPHQTGILSNGRLHHVPRLADTVPTLGSVFAGAGYKATHFGKQHDLGSLRGFNTVPTEDWEVPDEDPLFPVNYDTRRDSCTCQQTVDFLSSYNGDAPYLTVADLNNPHDICNWIGSNQGTAPLPPYDGELPPLPTNLYVDDEEFTRRPLPVQYICCAHNRQSQISEWSEEKIQRYLLAYHHYLSRVDANMARIVQALRKRSDADNTLVVFFADHGDSMCGRWMATKHTSFYEETAHVPFVFSGPGMGGKDRSVQEVVSLLDLVPTLCDYAGLAMPEGLEGSSLMPWLTGNPRRAPHTYVASQWHTEWGYTVEPGRMIRTQDFKYTHFLEGNGEELFDLRHDLGEQKTLIDDPGYASVLAEHRSLFDAYLRDTADPYRSMEWKADAKWRSHRPGYRHHRGPSAPMADA